MGKFQLLRHKLLEKDLLGPFRLQESSTRRIHYDRVQSIKIHWQMASHCKLTQRQLLT